MVKLRCPFTECNCAIVDLDESRYASVSPEICKELKLMLPSSEATSDGLFSVFEDIWDFDNIGVSRAVPDGLVNVPAATTTDNLRFKFRNKTYQLHKLQKYLICADCDRGPLGVTYEVKDTSNGGEITVLNMLSLASVKQLEN
ncbi:LAFA_0E17414g1_1 [Lachancea sp. 'fantastica']|nr:LAFA_0E17414g1_1 [Lachancea sp. 'fantastica']